MLTAEADASPDSLPGPALRVVLVEVGEEELAFASIPALTGQVHEVGTMDK